MTESIAASTEPEISVECKSLSFSYVDSNGVPLPGVLTLPTPVAFFTTCQPVLRSLLHKYWT